MNAFKSRSIAIFIAFSILQSCTDDGVDFLGPEQVNCGRVETFVGDYQGDLHYYYVSPDTLDTVYHDTIISAIDVSTPYGCLVKFDGIVRETYYVDPDIDSVYGSSGPIRFKLWVDSLYYYYYSDPFTPDFTGNGPPYNRITRIEFAGKRL
jgi:hypothetical protein